MCDIVLFGVGSPIVVDVEESLARAGVSVSAAVQNYEGQVHLLDTNPLIDLKSVTVELLEKPFLVPLFTPGNRQRAVQQARELGFRSAFYLADTSLVMPRTFRAGEGSFINVGCNVGAACDLKDFVFINRGVSLGHHARLERFVSIGPGAVVGSLVQIEQGALIGAGSVVLPKIQIGANAVVGAGAVVTKNVPAHCQVVGNPARIVKENIAGYGDLRVA